MLLYGCSFISSEYCGGNAYAIAYTSALASTKFTAVSITIIGAHVSAYITANASALA